LRVGTILLASTAERPCRAHAGIVSIELDYSVLRTLPYNRDLDLRGVELSACSVLENVNIPPWIRELHLDLETGLPEAQRVELTRARVPLTDFAREQCSALHDLGWSAPRVPGDAVDFFDLPFSGGARR
jgi:hypothetical protein